MSVASWQCQLPVARACCQFICQLLWHSFNKFVLAKRLHEPAVFNRNHILGLGPNNLQHSLPQHTHMVDTAKEFQFQFLTTISVAVVELGWAWPPPSPSRTQSLSCFVSVSQFWEKTRDSCSYGISCDISSVKCQIEFIDNALRSSPATRGLVSLPALPTSRTVRLADWEINQLLGHKFASQVATGPLLRNLWNAQSAPATHKSVLSGSSKATFEYANCYLSRGAL